MNKRMEGLVGNLTISRRSDDMIYIQITDESSKSRFVELEVSPSDFAMSLTGYLMSNANYRWVDWIRLAKKRRLKAER